MQILAAPIAEDVEEHLEREARLLVRRSGASEHDLAAGRLARLGDGEASRKQCLSLLGPEHGRHQPLEPAELAADRLPRRDGGVDEEHVAVVAIAVGRGERLGDRRLGVARQVGEPSEQLRQVLPTVEYGAAMCELRTCSTRLRAGAAPRRRR